jgi:hypothetical protein
MPAGDELHRLLDSLPESEIHAAKRFLEFLHSRSSAADPILHAFEMAPLDDEPFTEADEAAVRRARDDVARGLVVPLHEPTSSAPSVMRHLRNSAGEVSALWDGPGAVEEIREQRRSHKPGVLEP